MKSLEFIIFSAVGVPSPVSHVYSLASFVSNLHGDFTSASLGVFGSFFLTLKAI